MLDRLIIMSEPFPLDVHLPKIGEVVRCGPVGAVWEVNGVTQISVVDWRIRLRAIDPHEVPLSASVVELPRPHACCNGNVKSGSE